MTIGERIAVIRYQRGISLKELSLRTGLTLGMLSNIESDYVTPGDEILELVCRGLDFAHDELIRDDMLLAQRGATQIPVYTNMRDAVLSPHRVKPKGSVYISNMLIDRGEHFIVKVEDSAMDAMRMQQDDYILVKRQPFIGEHEVAVVCVGDNKPIVRSVVEREHETILFAKNYTGDYPPILVEPTDYFRIVGKVVRVIANLRQYNNSIQLIKSGDVVLSEELFEEFGICKPITVYDFKFDE